MSSLRDHSNSETVQMEKKTTKKIRDVIWIQGLWGGSKTEQRPRVDEPTHDGKNMKLRRRDRVYYLKEKKKLWILTDIGSSENGLLG